MARTAGSKNTKKRLVDPLLAALIAKLPPAGASDWPAEERSAWLRMMAMAFAVVYPGANFVPGDLPPIMNHKSNGHAEPAKPADASTTAQHAFYIDKEGYARIAGGERINAVEIDGQLFDLRGEGDLGAIIWADGSTGVLGKVLDIKPA